MVVRLALVLLAFVSPAAAHAAEVAAVPEGSHATLFALGALGVLIGRRLARRGRRED